MGHLRRPEDEGLLVEALASEDAQVAVAAAVAVGRAGTVAAVGPLREAAERGGDLRRAARQAVAEIQARLTGAAPGQLTLAGGEAGALSLAEGEPGRLSLAEGEGQSDGPAARQGALEELAVEEAAGVPRKRTAETA